MRCAVCDEIGVTRWVIDNGTKAGVAWACELHGQPVQELLDVAATEAPPRPVDSWPLVPRRSRRKVKPLDWEPPG